MPQGPNYGLQGGSVWVVGAGGTFDASSAGSLTLPPSTSFGGTVSIGGTAGRWAFGSFTLTSGTAIVVPGLSQIVSITFTPVTGGINAGTGAGTATSFQVDLSRAANGTAFALGLTGTSAFTGAGTALFQAFGY